MVVNAFDASKVGDIKTLKEIETLHDQLTDHHGASCIHYAARGGSLAVLEFLIKERGFSIFNRSKTGATALHDAAAKGNTAVVKWVLDNTDIKADDQDGAGITSLHLAARYQHALTVEWLIDEAECDVSIRTAGGAVPLHFAVVGADLNCVKILVDENQRLINMQMNNGTTPIYLACQSGHLEILKYLATRNGATKIKAYDGMSCLHAAAQMGHLDIVQWLVMEDKMNPNDRDFDGLTPLHYATSRGHAEIVTWLLTHGNARITLDNLGGSPLHTAAEHSENECIQALLASGCDVSLTDNDGLTAGELAENCDHLVSASLIRGESIPGLPLDTVPEQGDETQGAVVTPCLIFPPPPDHLPEDSLSPRSFAALLPPDTTLTTNATTNTSFYDDDHDHNHHNAVLRSPSPPLPPPPPPPLPLSTYPPFSYPSPCTPPSPIHEAEWVLAPDHPPTPRTNGQAGPELRHTNNVDGAQVLHIADVHHSQGSLPATPIVGLRSTTTSTSTSTSSSSPFQQPPWTTQTPHQTSFYPLPPKSASTYNNSNSNNSSKPTTTRFSGIPPSPPLPPPPPFQETQTSSYSDTTTRLPSTSEISFSLSSNTDNTNNTTTTSNSRIPHVVEKEEEPFVQTPRRASKVALFRDLFEGKMSTPQTNGGVSKVVPTQPASVKHDKPIGASVISINGNTATIVSSNGKDKQQAASSVNGTTSPRSSTVTVNGVANGNSSNGHDAPASRSPRPAPVVQQYHSGIKNDLMSDIQSAISGTSNLSLRSAKSRGDGVSMVYRSSKELKKNGGAMAVDNTKVQNNRLTGDFDPKNFLDQVETVDPTGRAIPEWRRLVLAKHVAEKALVEAEEKRKTDNYESRFKDMPAWKRALIERKEGIAREENGSAGNN